MRFLLLLFVTLSIMVGPEALSYEKDYASVSPDHTLIELGCSIAKALKDPEAESRCSRLLGNKDDVSTQKSGNKKNLEIVKNKSINL